MNHIDKTEKLNQDELMTKFVRHTINRLYELYSEQGYTEEETIERIRNNLNLSRELVASRRNAVFSKKTFKAADHLIQKEVVAYHEKEGLEYEDYNETFFDWTHLTPEEYNWLAGTTTPIAFDNEY